MMQRHVRGKTRFSVQPQQMAESVALLAEFTQWRAVPMRRLTRNRFVLDVLLPAGQYDYKFLVDGRWVLDPCRRLEPANLLPSVG